MHDGLMAYDRQNNRSSKFATSHVTHDVSCHAPSRFTEFCCNMNLFCARAFTNYTKPPWVSGLVISHRLTRPSEAYTVLYRYISQNILAVRSDQLTTSCRDGNKSDDRHDESLIITIIRFRTTSTVSTAILIIEVCHILYSTYFRLQ